MKVLEKKQVKEFYSYIEESLDHCSMSVISSLIMCNTETLCKNMDIKINDWKYKFFGERLKRLLFSIYILKTHYPEITPKELSSALRIPHVNIDLSPEPIAPIILINTSLEDTQDIYLILKNLCQDLAKKASSKKIQK